MVYHLCHHVRPRQACSAEDIARYLASELQLHNEAEFYRTHRVRLCLQKHIKDG